MSCLIADVEDGVEDRKIVEYLCPLLLGEHVSPSCVLAKLIPFSLNVS